MNRTWFVPETLVIKATNIQLVSDPSGSVSVNSVPVTGAVYTKGSSFITLVSTGGSNTITAMTCRGVTGPASTTPVPWTMRVAGNEISVQIAAFTISTITGAGTPIAIVVGPTIVAPNLPTVAPTAALRAVPMTNNNVNVATGFGELVTATGQLTLSLDAAATITVPAGPLADFSFSWLASTN